MDPRLTRMLAVFSALLFVTLALYALPDPAECVAPEVTFQRPAVLAFYACFTVACLVIGFAIARAIPALALLAVLASHVATSRALERIESVAPDDEPRSFHVHGPYGLVRTEADADGRALLASFRFRR